MISPARPQQAHISSLPQPAPPQRYTIISARAALQWAQTLIQAATHSVTNEANGSPIPRQPVPQQEQSTESAPFALQGKTEQSQLSVIHIQAPIRLTPRQPAQLPVQSRSTAHVPAVLQSIMLHQFLQRVIPPVRQQPAPRLRPAPSAEHSLLPLSIMISPARPQHPHI